MIVIILLPVMFTFAFLLQNINYFLPSISNMPFNSFIDGMVAWLSISYFEFGLIRRGLWGTLLSFISNPIVREAIFIAMNLIAITATFYLIFSKFYQFNKDLFKYMILLFSFTSLGAMQFGYTFGRFEQVNYLLIILCIILIDNYKIYLSSLLLVVGVLFHEAFAFYGVPLLFCYFLVAFKNSRTKDLLILFLPVTFITIYLGIFGNSEAVALGASRDLFEFRSLEALDSLLIIYIALIIACHITIIKSLNLKANLIDLAPYTSLILFLFGVDYARWTGILFFIIIISIYARVKNLPQINNFNLKHDFKSYLLAIPVFGPIGVVDVFPLFFNFLQLFSKL